MIKWPNTQPLTPDERQSINEFFLSQFKDGSKPMADKYDDLDPYGCKADADADAIAELERLAHERGLCHAYPHQHCGYCEDGNICEHCGGVGAFMDQDRLVCAKCLGDER